MFLKNRHLPVLLCAIVSACSSVPGNSIASGLLISDTMKLVIPAVAVASKKQTPNCQSYKVVDTTISDASNIKGPLDSVDRKLGS
ncbi:MAG: hypothetical protein K0R63_1328 [Rickettsiales bacterium]|jgi:hypothetical protein|nr:hypothetical protein [Rickettsiales bacterium]